MRFLAFFTLVLVAVLLAGLAGVDARPAAELPGLRTAVARLDSSRPRLALDLAPAPLRAGFSRIKLTPSTGLAVDAPERGEFRALPLAGYGQRQGAPAAGVHDDVWVKALAFVSGSRTGIVVAADLLIVPREVSDAAVEELQARDGLGRDQLYFGSTHTHSSLGGWGEGFVGEAFAGGFQPGVRTWIARQLVAAVRAAVADLRPAEVGAGAFAAPEFVRNRLVGDAGRVDPEFSLLVVRRDDGGRAVLGSYSAHATVLPGRWMEFSGDYPGVWQRAVERETGALALFIAGGVGSHAPKPPAGGMEGAEQMGERLAAATRDGLATVALTNRPAFALTTVPLELPELQPRITDGVRLRPWVARQVLPVHPTTWLQALRVGDAVWLSTPCDYSGEMALDLKAAARERGLRAVVTSFNGDYVGYVVPEKYYHLDTYETRTMSFYGPQLPEEFATVLARLVEASAAR